MERGGSLDRVLYVARLRNVWSQCPTIGGLACGSTFFAMAFAYKRRLEVPTCLSSTFVKFAAVESSSQTWKLSYSLYPLAKKYDSIFSRAETPTNLIPTPSPMPIHYHYFSLDKLMQSSQPSKSPSPSHRQVTQRNPASQSSSSTSYSRISPRSSSS